MTVPRRMVAAMAGAYRFSQTQMDVTATYEDGTSDAWTSTTVVLRDNQLRVRHEGTDVLLVPVTGDLTRLGRKAWSVNADDGTHVRMYRNCGCGGS